MLAYLPMLVLKILVGFKHPHSIEHISSAFCILCSKCSSVYPSRVNYVKSFSWKIICVSICFYGNEDTCWRSLHMSVLTSNPCHAPKNCRTVFVVKDSVFHKKYSISKLTAIYVLIIVTFKYIIFFIKTKSNSGRTILEMRLICISLIM